MGLRLKQLPRLVVERRSSVLLGLFVVALAWTGVAFKHWSDLRTARLDSDRTNHNFAMVFEENVLRSIGEIDKSLLYMRRSIEMRSGSEDYGTIANTTDLLSEIIVQVAIIDAAGIMRATNAGPQPPPPTDLSDRAHFRVHVDTGEDRLYISKPVVGRASGRVSVQFSRRFTDHLGRFAGVVVASLDPGHLTKFYDKIDFGSPASISLIGSDGIVRSSGGAGGGFAVGADLTESPIVERIRTGRSGTFEMWSDDEGTQRVVAIRKVRDQPLWVSVGVPAREVYRDAGVALRHDSLIAALATLLVGLAVERLLRIEEKRSEAEAHVARLAAEDPLTGLPNRRVFRAALAAVAERPGPGPEPQPFAVLFLDLDRFKLVNDTLGHKVGDGLLQEVGRRLSGLLGEGEMLARLGGDEFAVLMPAAGRPDAERLARRIAEAIARPLQVESHQIRTSVSVGVAIGPEDGADADDLLIAADLALYAVKASRRGAFRFYDRAMSEGLEERREIEAELRRALERNELELYCQPSIALAGGRIAGFEALTRWNHPVRGPIPPSLFIPIAEDCGLIHALGQWSLEEACRHAATWPGAPRIAVNLSPVQFAGQDLVAMVQRTLTRTGLPASRLELEITEQMLLDNSEHTRRVLRDLKALGLRIAMDDFGTGYSSLNYLRAFPFDKIKIDRSFVAGLGEGPGSGARDGTRDGAQTGAQNAAIVRAVIEIARSLGMHTTAEGVETPEQNRALAVLGCDEAQGYLYSRPVPVAAVPGLIAQWKPGASPAARPAPVQPRNVPNVA